MGFVTVAPVELLFSAQIFSLPVSVLSCRTCFPGLPYSSILQPLDLCVAGSSIAWRNVVGNASNTSVRICLTPSSTSTSCALLWAPGCPRIAPTP